MANYTLLIKLDFWETVHHISNNTCPSSCLIPVLGTKLLTIKFYTFVSDSYYLVDKNLCILNYNSSAKYLYLNLKIHFSSKQRSCYVVGRILSYVWTYNYTTTWLLTDWLKWLLLFIYWLEQLFSRCYCLCIMWTLPKVIIPSIQLG